MTRVLRSRAELRAALADAARPIGLVPTMGWLHDGHRSLIRRARAENPTVVASIFVNPRQFNEAADFTKYPRNEDRDVQICADGGRRHRLGAAGRRGLRAGLRHDRVGRCDLAAARGCGPARPLRRRGDRRRDPVRAGRRRARLLRPEGRPAGDGDPADGPRPGPADRGDRLPHRARAGRPGALVAQRPPHAGRASRGAGPPPGARSRRPRCGGRASARPRSCGPRCARCWRPSRWPSPSTSRSRTR